MLFSEQVASGSQNRNPETEISMTLPIVVFASIALLLCGWLMGLIEIVVLEHKFTRYKFYKKFIFKLLIYTSFIVLIIMVTYPIAASIELNQNILSSEIWDKTYTFYSALPFYPPSYRLHFLLYYA